MKKTFFILTFALILIILAACVDTAEETPMPTPDTNENNPPQDIPDPNPSVTDSEISTGAAYIIKAANGFSIGGSSFGSVKGEAVKFSSFRGDLDEIWRITELDGGSYNLINAASGLYLSSNINLQNGTALSLDKKDSKLLQSWELIKTDDRYFIKLAGEDLYLTSEVADKNCDAILCDEEKSATIWELCKVFDEKDELPAVITAPGVIGAPTSCPEIIKYNGLYYNINMTAGMMVKRSSNLKAWKNCTWVFDGVPSWIRAKLGNSAAIWAPGFYTVGNKLCIYYCASTLGSQNSLIGLVYAESPTGPFTDMGIVIESKAGDPYNCIDPNIFVDDDGKTYLVFGSYWEGIFMRRIDPETGLLDESETKLWHLAKGEGGLEAPYLVKHGDYYYLFVARGILGQNESYHLAVGRSKSLFGPYLDKSGNPMREGNSSALTENKSQIEGVAHAQPFLDSDGQWYLIAEAWPDDTDLSNNIYLHISKMVWSEDGWPVTALSPNIIEDLSSDISDKNQIQTNS